MKKIVFVLALSLVFVTAKAQLLSHYFDASITQLKGYGYSYNVTVQLRKVGALADGAEKYEMTLLTVAPDSKGFLYNDKYYSAMQLGSACATPNSFGRVFVRVEYNYVYRNGAAADYPQSVEFGDFGSIGQVRALTLMKGTNNITIKNVRVVRNDDGCVAKIKELLNPKKPDNSPLSAANQKSTELVVSNANKQSQDVEGNTLKQTKGKQNATADQNPVSQNVVRVPSTREQLKQLNIQSTETHLNNLNSYVSNMAADARAEREAKQAREDARMRANWEASEAKRKRFEGRSALIAQFPDGKTPLSSQVKQKEIYYFVYSYKQSDMYSERPEIKISNVFTLAKYGDDTWPFKTNLMQKIAKVNKGLDPIILCGYFTDKNQAEELRQTLVNGANDNGFAIINITYEGNKTSQAGEKTTDYWGNPTTPKTDTLKDQKTLKPKVDYWGNPIKN